MAEEAQIEGRLAQLLAELSNSTDGIGRDTSLSSLELDSLDLAEVAQTMADEYGAEIPTEELERVQTVGDLADVISAYATR